MKDYKRWMIEHGDYVRRYLLTAEVTLRRPRHIPGEQEDIVLILTFYTNAPSYTKAYSCNCNSTMNIVWFTRMITQEWYVSVYSWLPFDNHCQACTWKYTYTDTHTCTKRMPYLRLHDTCAHIVPNDVLHVRSGLVFRDSFSGRPLSTLGARPERPRTGSAAWRHS